MALKSDNTQAEQILKNSPTHAARTKHMDIKVKFCGEVIAKKNKILLTHVPTKLNFADIFTKPLSTVRFRDLRSIMIHDLTGIINNSGFLNRTFAVLKDFIKPTHKSSISMTGNSEEEY